MDAMKKNNRRGLSSIIGTSFVVMLTVSAMVATMFVLQEQRRATTEVTQEANRYLDGLSEKMEISNAKVSNDKLNVTLSNGGDSVARVKSIYIVNETASPKEQYRYDVDYLVDGRDEVTNVGQALPFVANDTTSYTIKIVTESGNSASYAYFPTSALPLSLSTIPPTVTTGENVTLLYTITNNRTTSTEPLTVSPTISSSVTCEGGQLCSATRLISGPSTVVIERNSFAIVKETYKVEGPPGTIVTFNASYAGAKAGNYVTEEAKVIIVSSTFSLSTGKATKPDIYLIIPGPFGDSNQHGLWGIVIVNPTNSTMKVSRVMATVFTAAHQGDVVMEEGCDDTAIFPLDEGEWDCPHDNQIQWRDLINPETLQPGKSMSFLVRVQPDNLGGSVEPGASVTATVYTDVGIFTKAGYTTSMRDSRTALANVYLTNTEDTSDALDNGNMLGHLNDLQHGASERFYVAIADFDTDDICGSWWCPDTQIDSGARLIINLPPGFGNVSPVSWDKFVDDPTVTVREDGITQIIGITDEDIGDSNSEAAVLAFDATLPSPTNDSTYIMYAFIEGTTNGSPEMSAGALAEIALQVNGTS